MRKEFLFPLNDFYKMRNSKQIAFYLLLPIVIGMVSFFSLSYGKFYDGFKPIDFVNDFLNSQINAMALFISFSMAYLSILVTSSSTNVIELKETDSKEYFNNNKPITLYQILLIDLTYTVVIEILLLILSFSQKFLVLIYVIHMKRVFLVIDVILLTHILLLMYRNLTNIYLSFWKPK